MRIRRIILTCGMLQELYDSLLALQLLIQNWTTQNRRRSREQLKIQNSKLLTRRHAPPPVHNPVIPVNNRVEKPVDNSPLINRGHGVAVGVWITNTIIKLILQSFPRLLIEKRYKLINFARVYIILWITRLLRLKSTGRCYDCLWTTGIPMFIT